MSYEDLVRRLTELERRVSALELGGESIEPADSHEIGADRSAALIDSASLVRVRVSNKRFDPSSVEEGSFQDHVWFDLGFIASNELRPARSLKGVLEFCDLFGEPKFSIGYTLTQRLKHGNPVQVSGVGFEYNQFMEDHQWMLGTTLDDMIVRFRVSKALYEDGTVEDFP